MKRVLVTLLMTAMAAWGFAQENKTTGEKSEWLPSFEAVSVSAAVDLHLEQIPATEAPRVVYDTKGSYTTKFSAVVKDKVLYITEKVDTRRTDRTSVTLYFNTLESLTLTDAIATFEKPFSRLMFDLTVGARASLTANFDIKDLKMELNGKSEATLTGKVHYLTLFVSTGALEAKKLEVVSAVVNAASSGSASLWVTDRLEAKTSTGGEIRYKGAPDVVRTGSKFMGGSIVHID